MLTTLSIVSMDQGKLLADNRNHHADTLVGEGSAACPQAHLDTGWSRWLHAVLATTQHSLAWRLGSHHDIAGK